MISFEAVQQIKSSAIVVDYTQLNLPAYSTLKLEKKAFNPTLIRPMAKASMTTSYGYGRLGMLLHGEDGCVYGVTGSHVTNQSIDGWLYIKDNNGDFSRFGKIVKCDVTNINQDINIFIIEQDWKHCCKSTCTDENDHELITRITTEPLVTLCGKIVVTSNREHEGSKDTICKKYGQIAAFQEHTCFDIDTDKFFLVAQYQNKNFFEEGDSGGIVAVVDCCGNSEYVGFVVGKYNHRNETKREYLLCLHIQNGLKALRNRFQIKFLENARMHGTHNAIIRPGIKLWVRRTCSISPSRECYIELCEHLIKLFDCVTDFVPSRRSCFWTETQYMKTLSIYVNNRTDIEPFDSPTADHKCYLHAILACDFILSENLEDAEKQLELALRYIGQTYAPMRLLCKIFSYSTWLFLKLGKLKEMQEILDQGIARTEYIKDNDVRIHDSIGYFYFDYARYFIKKDNTKQALKMAFKSLFFFESFESSGKKSTEKQALVWVMIARLNLNCGEYFEKRNCQALDMDAAKLYITKLYEHLDILPVLQKVCYYMVKADLQFRMGNYQAALKAANDSVNLSKEHALKEEFKKSVCKVVCLDMLIKSRKS